MLQWLTRVGAGGHIWVAVVDEGRGRGAHVGSGGGRG